MSFEQLNIPSFKKMLASLWFRIPHTTMQNVLNEKNAELARFAAAGFPQDWVFPRMMGKVPLKVFGTLREGYKVKPLLDGTRDTHWTESDAAFVGCGYSILSTTPNFSRNYAYYKGSKVLLDPSYIALDVSDDLTGILTIRLQMGDNGSGAWVNTTFDYRNNNWTALSGNFPTPPCMSELGTAYDASGHRCLTDGVYPGGTRLQNTSHEDITDLYAKRNGPESFHVSFPDDPVVPDRWHNVIASVDLDHNMVGEGAQFIDSFPGLCDIFVTSVKTGTQSISNPCKMWVTLDDKNLKVKIPAFSFVTGLGNNSICTDNILEAAQATTSQGVYGRGWDITGLITELRQDADTGIPTFSYTPTGVPASPLGLPCINPLSQYNRHCEMAEFQMWTGVAADTSVQAVRRLFVNAKGKPELNYKAVDKVFGKPKIRLHGSGNWIKGKNTGSGGQFTTTGKIKAYKPDPSLHGDQGKPQ